MIEAPDEITEDYIEHVCDSLKCEIINILENDDEEFKQEAYDNASLWLDHIRQMMDDL